MFISHNPFTEEQLAVFPLTDDAELNQTMQAAYDARKGWQALSFDERGQIFIQLAALITAHESTLAQLASLEMGKPISEALLEIRKCTTACHYYAAQAERILAPENIDAGDGRHVKMVYEPMGTVLGIFPWNFPYWQIIRSAIPILMSGNTMLIKPAPNVPQCSLALQSLFDRAGLPKGVIQTVFIDEQQVARCIADNRIDACTLTGSEKAGSAVASEAARHIKKTVLELGGSDPFIVTAHADVALALSHAVVARFQNNGQSCIAAKRFIIHESIADVFINELIARINGLRCGNPLDSETQIGPLARKDLRDQLDKQVQDSIAAGAIIHYQMRTMPASGYFYPPTVLTHIPEHAPAVKEELFGPVLSMFTYQTPEDAIRMANDTPFGLGASVWSSNPEEAHALAKALRCGQVNINSMVKSDTRFPFGGYKKSGIGKELGAWGLKEFCEVKTIWSS